jgi:CheY-like chemotaxis protein
METGVGVDARLGDRCLDSLVDALSPRWRTGKRARMDDADECARHTKQRLDDARSIHRRQCRRFAVESGPHRAWRESRPRSSERPAAPDALVPLEAQPSRRLMCFEDGNILKYSRCMAQRVRVLVVEDDLDLRRMFRQALVLAGFDVHEAGDGLEALRAIDRDGFDAVILDLGLPILSGYVVRQEIAAQPHTRQIPVIVVTGRPGPHDQLDVSCVLRKPVSPDRLIQTVHSCIDAGGTAFHS